MDPVEGQASRPTGPVPVAAPSPCAWGSSGSGFDVTEMGTEKRLALWVVGDPEEVEGVATLGVDPLDASFDTDALAALWRPRPET